MWVKLSYGVLLLVLNDESDVCLSLSSLHYIIFMLCCQFCTDIVVV